MDQLLNLNSVELGKLVEALGLSLQHLQRSNRVQRGPLSPETFLRILSGAADHNGPVLPAHPKEAQSLILACAATLDRTTDALQREELEKRLRTLEKVKEGLEQLHRVGPLGKIGVLANVGLNVRVFQYPKDGKNAAEQLKKGGLIDLYDLPIASDHSTAVRRVSELLRPALGVYLGIMVGEKERVSGRRKIEPWASPSFLTSMGGVWYTAKKGGGSGYGGKVSAPGGLGSGSYDPIKGRGFSLGFQFVGAIDVSERYLGLSISPGALLWLFRSGTLHGLMRTLDDGFKIPGIQRTRAVPSVDVGIRSDYIHHLTAPVFALLDIVQRALGPLTRALRRKSKSTSLSLLSMTA